MTSALATAGTLMPMASQTIERVRKVESFLAEQPQVEIPTQHLIHAGMYLRTICIPAGVALTGALIKRATALIVSGDCLVYTEGGALKLQGYHVVPASAGRKQVFYAERDTWLTMSFPTNAHTVAEAEAEFTDETELLLSHTHGQEVSVITGE